MANHSDTAILILAAGESRRLGAPKQLIEFEGETLVRRIARRAAASNAGEVLVVLGHQANTIEPELHDLQNVRAIHNPEWHLGMGASIRCGAQALGHRDAILISVCDQPHLTTDIFNQLIAQLPTSAAGIVCSRYLPMDPIAASALPTPYGVPAIFAREHFPALLALPGDTGAKALIGANDVDSIDFPLGAIDIDTPDDLKHL